MKQKSIETKRMRKRQAVVSALMNGAALLLGAGLTLWARAQCPAGPMSVFLLALAVFMAACLIPLAISLRQRFREIDGGELDEARQY